MQHRRKGNSIDGFVDRSTSVGSLNDHKKRSAVPEQFLKRRDERVRTVLNPVANNTHQTLPKPVAPDEQPVAVRDEISQSLRAIDSDTDSKKRPRRRLRVSKRVIVVLLTVIILLFGAYFGFKVLATSSRLFSGSIFDLLGAGTSLRVDQYGRSNILVFGTSEDDPGHSGANLTDSIMIISVDQKAKNAYMISVPRDLWVKYGEACLSGYEGKINVAYECGSDGGTNETGGAKKLMNVVGETFDIDLQYYAHVNYSVVRDTVNAVGGVTVDIDSDDPRGVLDRNFDWACNYQCHYVKWPNGPASLDGDQALALARARNASGGYGLGGGNFDREQYQQKIIVALKDKAASAGTLANPVKISGILDALGDNVRTNFSAAEVKTLMTLAGATPSADIKRVSLVETGKAVLTTGSISGQSAVRPVAGVYDFTKVRQYIRSIIDKNTSTTEEPSIEVLNGSDFGGLASKKAAELQAAGFSDVSTGDTTTSDAYGVYVWYDLSGGSMPSALGKLKSILGSNPAGTTLPGGVQSDADFVIILGNGAN